ncbi:MAG: HAD family hydrolase [Oscillospiraceae bacterium]|jgi:putative hydrolase of the HAD superfamily
MNNTINTIFFDVGATLRVVVEDPDFSDQAERKMMELVGATCSRQEFFETLEQNWNAYRKNAKTTLLDVSEMELWTQWLLPCYPHQTIAKHSALLTKLWRDRDGRRVPRPGVRDTILELFRRGYRLGIIANTITEYEIPNWMIEDGISPYITTTILSAKVRFRKPDPNIYWLAARAIGSRPAECAYIGDNPKRDVEGTFAAGYGLMVRIQDLDQPSQEDPSQTHKPHHIIHQIPQLLEIFPPLK